MVMERLKVKDNSKVADGLRFEEDDWRNELIDTPINSLPDAEQFLVYPHSFTEVNDDAEKLNLFTRFKGGIWTTNLMGFLSYKGHPIEVSSRFTPEDGKDYFLYYMLQRVLHLNVFNLPHPSSEDRTLDFLMFLFPKMLKEALSQGLFRQYQNREFNDDRVRGTIDVGRFIRRDIPFLGKVAYRTREYSSDNNITQLIRHTIEHLRHHALGQGLLNNDPDTRAGVQQVVAATPTYNPHDLRRIINANLRPLSHPYYTKYRDLQQLCLRILRHEGLSYGANEETFGILFDGAWLWEEYINTILSPLGFHHPRNKEKAGGIPLFKDDKSIHQRYCFPDFLRKDGFVLDAKYKFYAEEDKSIKRDDLMQILSYMYRLKATKAGFVCPMVDDTIEKHYEVHPESYGGPEHASIDVFSLQIASAANDEKQNDFLSFCRKMQENEASLIKAINS